MQMTVADPVIDAVGRVLRLDLWAPMQSIDPMPSDRRNRTKPGRAEAGSQLCRGHFPIALGVRRDASMAKHLIFCPAAARVLGDEL